MILAARTRGRPLSIGGDTPHIDIVSRVPLAPQSVIHRLVRPVGLLVVTTLIASLALAAAPAPGSAATGAAAEVFDRTNAQRASAGLPALVSDPALDAAAGEWARYLAKSCTFTHSSSEWRSSRIDVAGWAASGENIAAGYLTPADVMGGWMASPGHAANILNRSYTGLGVGYATGTCYRTYWVQIFGIAKPALATRPAAVSGTNAIGATLTASSSGWPAGTSLAWQWLSDGRAISGATASRYSPTISDSGKRISARVTGSHPSYFPASSTSAATRPVTGGATTTRMSGGDRYATSAAIARAGYPSGADTVFVASGTAFPDALSAAPAAAAADAPVLLTDPDRLGDATRAALEALAPERIVVVGGTGAVSPEVEDALGDIAPTSRIGGGDRYATSRALVDAFFTGSSTAYVATGTDFPDALTAGAAAGALGAPVLLVDGRASDVSPDTLSLLRGLGTTSIRVVGGTGAVSEAVARSLASAGAPVQRLSGTSRYGTAAAINAQAFASESTVYLAAGTSFADALSGAAIAGASGIPLFTTASSCLVAETDAAITRLRPTTVTLLGGTGALSADVAALRRC